MLCFPVSAFSRLVVPVLLPAVWFSGGSAFPAVWLSASGVCVRVRVCCLLCPVFRFCLGLWPCSMFSFLPFASRATTQGPIFGQVTPSSWSTYDRYATAVVFASGGVVAYSFGSLSISFSSVFSSLPYTSSVGLQERSSLEGESLRRIASTRRGWRCPCSGVRTEDLWLTSPGVFAQEHAVDLGFKRFVCYLLSSLIVVAFLHEPSAGTA